MIEEDGRLRSVLVLFLAEQGLLSPSHSNHFAKDIVPEIDILQSD